MGRVDSGIWFAISSSSPAKTWMTLVMSDYEHPYVQTFYAKEQVVWKHAKGCSAQAIFDFWKTPWRFSDPHYGRLQLSKESVA